MLGRVNVERSECSRAADRESIHAGIRDSVGFGALGRMVFGVMEGWMVEELRAEVAARRRDGDERGEMRWSDVMGNVLGPIFVYATSLISVSMILASGLSFLGLGTKPPEPEWGLMLNTLRTAIYVQPWVAILPGICIFVTSICFNLVSDGLRQAMDVKG